MSGHIIDGTLPFSCKKFEKKIWPVQLLENAPLTLFFQETKSILKSWTVKIEFLTQNGKDSSLLRRMKYEKHKHQAVVAWLLSYHRIKFITKKIPWVRSKLKLHCYRLWLHKGFRLWSGVYDSEEASYHEQLRDEKTRGW